MPSTGCPCSAWPAFNPPHGRDGLAVIAGCIAAIGAFLTARLPPDQTLPQTLVVRCSSWPGCVPAPPPASPAARCPPPCSTAWKPPAESALRTMVGVQDRALVVGAFLGLSAMRTIHGPAERPISENVLTLEVRGRLLENLDYHLQLPLLPAQLDKLFLLRARHWAAMLLS
jgi:hypothetical protein